MAIDRRSQLARAILPAHAERGQPTDSTVHRASFSHLGRPQSVGCVARPDLVHHAAPLEGRARLEGACVSLLAPCLHVVYRLEDGVLDPDGVDHSPVDHFFREDSVGPVPQGEGAEGQCALVYSNLARTRSVR